jgi:hypothetical protein
MIESGQSYREFHEDFQAPPIDGDWTNFVSCVNFKMDERYRQLISEEKKSDTDLDYPKAF